MFFLLGLFSGEAEYQAILTFMSIGANEKISVADALNLLSLSFSKNHKKLAIKLDWANKIASLYLIFTASKESSVKVGDWKVKVTLDHSYGQKFMVRGHVEQKEFETYFNKKKKMKGSKLTHFF